MLVKINILKGPNCKALQIKISIAGLYLKIGQVERVSKAGLCFRVVVLK